MWIELLRILIPTVIRLFLLVSWLRSGVSYFFLFFIGKHKCLVCFSSGFGSNATVCLVLNSQLWLWFLSFETEDFKHIQKVGRGLFCSFLLLLWSGGRWEGGLSFSAIVLVFLVIGRKVWQVTIIEALIVGRFVDDYWYVLLKLLCRRSALTRKRK